LANANGFRVPPDSATGLAESHAVVANPTEIGATPYNPAAMAFHDGIQLSGGLLAINSRNTVSNAAGSSTSDVSNPSIIPIGFMEGGLTNDWRWGVAFNAPFGQQTKWPAGSFPAFVGPLAPLAPTLSKVKLFNVNPMIAGKLGSSTGFGIGLDYYKVMEAKFDSEATTLKGKGSAVGWNIGLLHSAPPWSFGIAYRSSTNIEIKGDFAIPLASAPARSNLQLPAIVQAGGRYEVRPDMFVEFDLDFTRWSQFDVLTIDHSNPYVASPIVNTNRWRNTVTYRLGWTYRWRPDTTLRLGYGYDPSAVPDAHFSPRTPDPPSNSFSVGIGQTLGGWQVDAGYMYVRYTRRPFNASVPFGTYGLDPNGTEIFNGTYNSKAQLFALNVTKRF
jgi:long-chain fatty acid transport protein